MILKGKKRLNRNSIFELKDSNESTKTDSFFKVLILEFKKISRLFPKL
ncbi:hypothetical protein SAMN05444363_0173 [Flavobacterium terrae]|uniref:Uncharacterized protein n=1 Tax=Flavobacterium terrae TaxID=415425 RepID=A0A1M6AEQ4_9FLAO|nr:hypothetical protein SAMN05444363_0173 [Flavobacterium terrae]